MSKRRFAFDKKSIEEEKKLALREKYEVTQIMSLSDTKENRTEHGEIVYIVVEAQEKLKRSHTAKEEAAEPWFFTHI